MGFLGILKFLL